MAIATSTAILGAAAIGAAAPLLGGGGDNPPKPRYGKQYRLAREHSEYINKNQLQWRVEDAKKAGLHPLFALGGGTVNSTPSIIPGQSYQKPPGKTERVLTAAAQGLQAYANYQSQARLNESMASYYDSLALRNQPGAQGAQKTAAALGAVDVVPDQQISANPKSPETSAGTHPAMVRHRMGTTPKGRGVYMDTPGKMEDLEITRSMVEVMKATGVYNFGLSVKENIQDFKNMMKSRHESRKGSTRKQRRQYRDWR